MNIGYLGRHTASVDAHAVVSKSQLSVEITEISVSRQGANAKLGTSQMSG